MSFFLFDKENGWQGRTVPELLDHTGLVDAKTTIFNPYSLVLASIAYVSEVGLTPSEKVQLTRRSPTPKGAQKCKVAVFPPKFEQ